MATQEGDSGLWLTLHEASTRLGLSPSTVRRWADAGRIPVRRTAGGHRRFDRQAVQALTREQRQDPPPAPGTSWHFSPPATDQQSWYVQLHHSPAGSQMRELGQRLLGLVIQYLVWQGDDSRFLADGQAVGAAYGAGAHAAGITLAETVQAFLYFRSTFWRMAVQIPPVAQATDMHEMIRLSARIDQFMDRVLLSTVAGYEQATSPALPGK